MSGLFEDRTDGASRREARTQQEQLARRKTRIIAVSVVTALALLFVGALIINSSFIRRSATAITIGGVDFTATEFDYFYNNAFHEFQNWANMQEFVQSPQAGRSLRSQIRNLRADEDPQCRACGRVCLVG
jgi:hypothetical protein